MKTNFYYVNRFMVSLIVITVQLTSAAQTSPPIKSTKPQVTPIATSRAEATFELPPSLFAPFTAAMLERGKIDPAYFGHNPSVIFPALEAVSNLRKGEFESSADFEERRTKAMSGAYLPGLKLTDQLAFILDTRRASKYFSGLGYSYDADSAEASLYVIFNDRTLNEIGSPSYDASGSAGQQARVPLKVQVLKSQKIDERQYQASNAYGATVTVTKSVYKTIALGLERLDFVPWQKEFPENPQPVSRVKMEASVAARELPKLKTLILARPLSPYVNYDFTHQEPTRDNPKELIIQTRIIRAIVDEVIFFSGITGEIIYRAKSN